MGQREAIAVGSQSRASRFPVRAAEVLTATRVITFDEAERFQWLVFGPNAASRNVDLPAEEACAGVVLTISNTSTAVGATLVVRNDAAATVATIAETTAGNPNAAIFACDGTAWVALVGA